MVQFGFCVNMGAVEQATVSSSKREKNLGILFFRGHFRDILGKFQRQFWGIFWGLFVDKFGTFLGYFRDILLTFCGCSGDILVTFCDILGTL